MQAGRHQDAIALLHAALAQEPNDDGLLCQLAAAELGIRNHAAAQLAAERAIASQPESEWAHRLRSIALRERGQTHSALRSAEEAVRLAPLMREGHFVLGNAQLGCGFLRDARATATRLLEMAPAWPDSHDLAGRVELAFKRNGAAEACFREALRLEPTKWLSMNNLGVAVLRQGRKRDAMEIFHSAVRLDPRAELAQKNLGVATKGVLGSPRFTTGYVLRLAVATVLVPWIMVPLGWVILVRYSRARWRARDLHPSIRMSLGYGDNRALAVFDLFVFFVTTFLVVSFVTVALLSLVVPPRFGLLSLVVGAAAAIGLVGRLVWRAAQPERTRAPRPGG
jgi:tetratricopeptide (TPR) repeat protein